MIVETVEAGGLIYDMSQAPAPRDKLAKRQDNVGDVTALPSSRLSSAAAEGTASPTGSGAIATATGTSDEKLPRPFDSSLGNNFTSQSCPVFFDSFLSNQTFQDCLPLSLLLQTSNSFFTTSRSLFRLTHSLDTSCNAPFATCSALMANLAQQIQSPRTCGDDLEMQNPQVLQAYHGFLAYEPVYRAGCLQNPETGSYCFANALTNASAPTSSYIYYLPLGVQLPGGTRPACSQCLIDTMAVFASNAGNSSQPVSKTYGQAASMVEMSCGPGYVEDIAAVDSGADGLVAARGSAVLLTIGVLASTVWGFL
ncbi:hypothetical protein MBLNU230_g2540t1 [Neophaeotheca triangularis]